ncbi:hypothetical protein OsJ_33305 [Oryza sativa Japonica Group]|uniref:Uncharacterized protein n=1 Tax=Oryza sativa subsp. japonica TaxID=39947 RepID=B9G9X0_ORYSJ|nr:hypothetical protein OsJ_33305 [Oryza sativa Japonica Group]
MMPSGPLNPMGPGQPVGAAASLLRTSSSLLSGGQQGMGSGGGMIPSQSPFSSLVSPRTQFGANGLLGGGSNVSSLLNRPFGNGGHMLGPGLMPGGGGIPMNTLQQQRGGLDGAGDLVGVGATTTAAGCYARLAAAAASSATANVLQPTTFATATTTAATGYSEVGEWWQHRWGQIGTADGAA